MKISLNALLFVSVLLAPVLSLETTLRKAADGTGIFVGSCMKQFFLKDDFTYASLAAEQYDLLTACNACKLPVIAKGWNMNQMNYTGCDYMRTYARKNNITMRGHVLLWANLQPFNNPKFIWNNDDPSKLEPFLEEYIKNTVTRYKDTIYAWDVVNEAIASAYKPYTFWESPWNKHVDDFMCKSFRWAHEADPNAELYYNDFSHMSTYGKYKKKADKVFNYLKNMTERGCPIHGVGFQAHIDLSFDQHYVKGFIQNMKRYEEIGLKSDSDLWLQAGIYQNLINACLEAPNCMNFETWGFTEKYEWVQAPKGLVFDENMQKKYSYYSMLNSLKAYDRESSVAKAKMEKQSQVFKMYPNNNDTLSDGEQSAEFL